MACSRSLCVSGSTARPSFCADVLLCSLRSALLFGPLCTMMPRRTDPLPVFAARRSSSRLQDIRVAAGGAVMGLDVVTLAA